MLELITGVATADEALTLAAAKAWLREDSDDPAVNADIESLIAAARVHAEGYLGRCVKEQTFELYLQGWPACGYIQIPRHKVSAVTVTYRDSSEGGNTLSTGLYFLDDKLSRVVLRHGASWPSTVLSPSSPITVAFTAGDDANEYPTGIVLFCKQAVAHWYRNRESVTLGNSAVDSKLLEMGAYRLLDNNPGCFQKYT